MRTCIMMQLQKLILVEVVHAIYIVVTICLFQLATQIHKEDPCLHYLATTHLLFHRKLNKLTCTISGSLHIYIPKPVFTTYVVVLNKSEVLKTCHSGKIDAVH